MKLQDQVAIVTGATKGIGLACAQEFALEGAKVVLSGRTLELGEAAAQEICSAGGTAIFVPCDVSQKAQVDALVQATLQAFGRIDIVVNNAGVNHSAKFFEITEKDWDWVMAVDLKGTFLLSQAAARVMVEQGIPGRIINLSSVMALLALADQVPYCAAKGGVVQLTKAMALALADYGIRVNAIGPGPVLTELMQRVVHNKEKEAELMARLPIGRIAECREIARVAVFLASDDSSYIIGQTIYPDGGRSIQGFPRKMEK
ncbi:MAG TPA: SDR family NAD(P)-dependent oxidoreductase [Anaerolineae bacterium]|nr:SDR family NAD(P)-dependent oxidoreductase [Anaerolineae bacterium]